jgi:hypothetical protein
MPRHNFAEHRCSVDSTTFINIYLTPVLGDNQAKMIQNFKLWLVIMLIKGVRLSLT